MPAYDRNSKPDTRLLLIRAGGGAAALAVDQSQWGLNLTNNATYLTSADALLGVRAPREIAIVAILSNTGTGLLINFGNVAGTIWNYRIEVSGASGLIRFHHNSFSNLAAVLLPNLGPVARTYLLHWSTYYSEGELSWASEFAVCDIASNTWNFDRKTHTQPPMADVLHQLNVSGFGAGLSPFSGGLSNIESVRLSNSYHSTAAAQEDWVAESPTPTTVGYIPPMPLTPVAQGVMFEDLDLTDIVNRKLLTAGTNVHVASYAGPAEMVAAVSAEAHQYRLWGPLLNVTVNAAPTLQNTYLPANFYAFFKNANQVSDLRCGINHLYSRPIPPGMTFGRVRVFVQTWIAGGAPGGTAVVFRVGLSSLPARPTTAPIDPAGSKSTDTITCAINHLSSGVGQWLELGELPLVVGTDGFSWFALGCAFGTGVGASFLRARIKRIVIDGYRKA